MENLYHYTSINKLALILESKKIRFCRLDLVNDPHEGISSDFGTMAMFIFVSCWTKNNEENFALWNMYTEKMRGVRIEMPFPLFNSYSYAGKEDFLVAESDFFNKEEGLFILTENNPINIYYTDDEEKLFPKIRTDIGIKTNALGTVKRNIWKMEDEVRYKMTIIPFNKDKYYTTENIADAFKEFIDYKIPPKIYFYDIDINMEAFKKMNILIGPKMEAGDRQIIESLIVRFNPTAKIEESKLKGSIK